MKAFPPGITVVRATSPEPGGACGPRGGPPTPSRWRTSAKKVGSLSPLPPPPGAPPRRAWRGGTREAQPRFALSQPTRGIRANPCPIRLSRQGPDHSSEGSPSEREALRWSKACATSVSHLLFVRGPPLRRHVLDPRRRKSSIISRPLEARFSCSHWTIFSMTTPKPPWRSTVSQSVSAMAFQRTVVSGLAAAGSRVAQD